MILITRLFGGCRRQLPALPGVVAQSGGYDRTYPAICRRVRPRERRAPDRIFTWRASIPDGIPFTNDYV